MLDDTKITEPMYLDKKVLKIVKTSLSNPESEISKIIKEESSSGDSIDDITTSGKTIILNGGTADE